MKIQNRITETDYNYFLRTLGIDVHQLDIKWRELEYHLETLRATNGTHLKII